MGWKCSVPGCRSNYDTEAQYTAVFTITEARKELWCRNIPRSNWVPTVNSAVCIRHFVEEDLSRIETYTDKNGITKSWERDRVKLKDGAIPRIFPELPSRFSRPAPKKRTCPEERRRKFEDHMEKCNDMFLQQDRVNCFEDLCSGNEKKLCVQSSSMKDTGIRICYFVNNNVLCIYSLKTDDIPCVLSSVKIYNNLSVEVCVNNNYICNRDLSWILDTNLKLRHWSQLENLVTRYIKQVSNLGVKKESFLESILQTFEKLNLCEEDESHRHLLFMWEQLKLSVMPKRKYSCHMLLYAFVIYQQSPSSYDMLRQNKLLLLPHPKYLQQIAASINISPQNQYSNRHFLVSVAQNLNEREKLVVLQIDEIYIDPKIEFKGGKLIGVAENCESNARTVQAFLFFSAFGSIKEVVSLNAVKNITGEQLFEMTCRVMSLLKNCGFVVIAIIADNNRVNRKLFDICSKNSKEKYFFEVEPGHKVFLTHDFVHVFKCIRNCWLNNKRQELKFPAFIASQDISMTAKFSDIVDLYKREQCALLKVAPKLNRKSVFPSSFERQRVSLVENVFHDTTIAALSFRDNVGTTETAEFFKIINRWWKIVNERNPAAGICKENDHRLLFLKQFLDWLQRWEKLNENWGKLSKETHSALYRCTLVLIEFVTYAMTTLKQNYNEIQYVLSFKLQTDNLEARFSCYRQLSGGNYNVSLCQVLESEKKIRIKSILGLNSARYGEIKFSPDSLNNLGEIDQIQSDSSEALISSDEIMELLMEPIELTECENAALLYISGYVSFKMAQNSNCQIFVDHCISKEKDLYMRTLDRGGLAAPSRIVYKFGALSWAMMSLLVSEKYEKIFLCQEQSHKELLVSLVMHALKYDDLLCFYDDVCMCGSVYKNWCWKIVSTFCNILLNNYTKMRNELQAQTKKQVKRKLNIYN